MNKFLIGGVVLVIAVGVYLGISGFSSNTSKLTDYSSATADLPADVQDSGRVALYSLTEVEKHKDATSCWTVVRDGVYNLTVWIDQHPGGADKILSICGKDGTEAFTNKHEGQVRPENELAGFQIGRLATQ
jgi:cytochrome b involved in lipid metabolism